VRIWLWFLVCAVVVSALAGVSASVAGGVLRVLLPDGPPALQTGYLLCFPLTAAGLWLIARRLRPWSSTRVLDATIVMLGIAQLTWALVLLPLVPAVITAALTVAMVLRLGRALRDRVSLQQELAFRAQHDVLTGLANRELFGSSLQAGIDASGEIGLLVIDLDGFKDVNDTLGHPAGDELLLGVTARLRSVAGPGDLLARLGGDEFAVICPPSSLERLSGALVAELALPYLVAGREQRISASVGVYSGRPATTGEALQNADLALYAAKEAGRNRAVRYHADLREAHVAHTVLADQLRAALDRGTGFALHYQPVVDTHSTDVKAVEALLRFTTPDGAPVSPATFVPVAEEIGLIGRLGAWVLERACADAQVWHAEHGISVTVNVSGRQLSNPQFADEVLAVLKRTGLPGAALVLEITETVLVTASIAETAEVSRRLARLRAFGIRIAIDDFGTGYSSLAYLRTLPLDVLKIDRAFVSRIEEQQDKALFRAVVELARSMYLQPVAEGVETAGQARVLRELNCDLAQGFLFARPMPAPALSALLEQRSGAALALLGGPQG
jgi:diguanylate cyclase (GGDEF)-like protein